MEFCRKLSPELFMAELALTTEAVLVDVRTEQELTGDPAIPGAIHRDFLQSDFESWLEEIDKFQNYFLYDQSGKRGRMACEMMVERGFLHAAFMEGGKAAWNPIFKSES
mgnify:CR=1 FL=1